MENETKVGEEVKTESRRKFLKTAGKFAIYTPPALMLMSNANATYVKDSTGNVKKYRKKKYGRKSYGRKKYGAKKRISFRRFFS